MFKFYENFFYYNTKLIPVLNSLDSIITPSTIKFAAKQGDSQLFPANAEIDGVKKWGYINSEGVFIILPQFENAKDFQKNDLAVIRIDSHEGLINKECKIVLNATFDYINDFSERFAIGYNDLKSTIITDKGIIAFRPTIISVISQMGLLLFQRKQELMAIVMVI